MFLRAIKVVSLVLNIPKADWHPRLNVKENVDMMAF